MDGTTLQIPAMQSLVSDFPWRRHERIDLSFGFVTHPSFPFFNFFICIGSLLFFFVSVLFVFVLFWIPPQCSE